MPKPKTDKSENNLISDTITVDHYDNLEPYEKIVVKGAREHNLKNISLEIPRDKITVITGLSGSGKSSLAFDTLYAEGQRRYVECLSTYAKQFIGMMKKPDVDIIEGLSPAISIEQKTLGYNPRSTVGTVTEIYDYIRLLYAKIGIQYCINCNIPVEQKTKEQILDTITKDFDGLKIQIFAPMIKGRKGHYRELFEQFLKQGYTKVRIDGEIKDLKPGMQLARYQIHNIDLLIDRLVVEEKSLLRITESIEYAISQSEGNIIVLYEDKNSKKEVWIEKLFSTSYTCPSCGKAYETLSPNMFSFNSPFGACRRCHGIGEVKDFDLKSLIDYDKTIAEGGIKLVNDKSGWLWTQVNSFAKMFDVNVNIPIKKLESTKFKTILYGNGEDEIDVEYKFQAGKTITYKQKYIGILPTLKHQHENASTNTQRNTVEEYLIDIKCPDCNGGRLKKENLFVKINDENIDNICSLAIPEAIEYFNKLPKKLNARRNTLAKLILREISSRLEFLNDVGLNYLSLNRSARSLSGGESQRIRLASQIGSKLVGIMYVLDEPSIGLHQHDNYKLINSLKNLRDLGNTLVIVEHDKSMIMESDHFIDIGPRAGIHGGEIVLESDPSIMLALSGKKLTKENAEILDKSITAQYLTGKKEIAYSKERRQGNGKFIKLLGARGNNLLNVDLTLPLGKFICVTGMSGSGKSSLINDTLYPILSKHFYNSIAIPLQYKAIEGLEHIDKIIEIDQSPIGRTPRSNPSTYTGLFQLIRDFFAMMPEAKLRGYLPGRFSFNVKSGRCEECEGAGMKKIEMSFLPDVYVKCDICNGKRYNPETLTVLFKGHSIADVLDLTVEEAMELFQDIPRIYEKLKVINDVGLNYITLGQQAPTLSGGEAQRVKLATELSKRNTGKTLYLLDEPTTGLHFEDINILMTLLNKLADLGNTVIVIEHNLEVIKCADWIIDLGPEGGKNGGKIVAEGTPEEVVKNKKSLTGKYLVGELK